MSITSDIRAYADTALEQGKQVVGQAQAQLTDVTGQANQFVNKITGSAKDNVSGLTNDLRSQAEKTLNLEAIKSAVEPYLAQAKQYSTSVTDRAEGLVGYVLNDKRVAKVVHTAETLTGAVVDTVNQRVIVPVATLTGRGPKLAGKPMRKSTVKATASKPAAKTKPAATRPASKRTTTKATPAKKTTAKSTTAKATTRKAPAKKASSSS